MKVFASIVLSQMDRPLVEREVDDEGGPTQVRVHLSDSVSLVGDEVDVRRWVREAALRVAELESDCL